MKHQVLCLEILEKRGEQLGNIIQRHNEVHLCCLPEKRLWKMNEPRLQRK
jgi:hypothetical protein